jgi:hypothetical protein
MWYRRQGIKMIRTSDGEVAAPMSGSFPMQYSSVSAYVPSTTASDAKTPVNYNATVPNMSGSIQNMSSPSGTNSEQANSNSGHYSPPNSEYLLQPSRGANRVSLPVHFLLLYFSISGDRYIYRVDKKKPCQNFNCDISDTMHY